MKLVDILARELTEWAGDVGAITQDKLTGELFDYYHCPLRGGNEPEVSSIADDAGEAHDGASGAAVTRAEWQAAVDALNAPKVVEWDGVGDPPVGVVCQYSVLNGPWYTCEVGYSFFDGEHRCFVIKCKHLGFEQVCRIDPGSEGSVEFRPFRTAEQVAAEDREAEDNEVMSRYMSLSDCQKGILGHSPERAIIGLMRVMGYRKEPKPCGS